MPKFIVTKKEIWDQPVIVEAATEKEALEKVWKGEGETMEESFEYSHTMDSASWSTEEAKDE
jgi:hypothetical protein